MGERLGGKRVVTGENWHLEEEDVRLVVVPLVEEEEVAEGEEEGMGLKETCAEGNALHPFLA